MGDENLSLLFKLRADNAQAKATIADTRAAISSLRGSFGDELSQMQSASAKAFGSIQGNLTNFIGRIPGGNIFVNVTSGLKDFHSQSDKASPALKKFNSSLEDLSKTTGKSQSELVKFLSEFVKLPDATDRGIAGYIKFGSKFDELEPKLQAAGLQLAAIAEESAGAGTSFAALAGPIGVAVLAVGALAAGAFVLTKMLFGLAESAADYRGKMFDMAQQTGVSTETLSALEIVAKRTGTTIEGIVAPLGIFQKHLEDAQDPTSAMAKKFAELGVTTNNTEDALRQTLTVLAAMPEGFHQTATALELFGRGGRSFLAILKETNGDLDGTIEKFRELGLIVSEEDAKAADEFNDQLAILGFQFRALLGKEVIPAALNALQDVSKTLKDNKQNIDIVAKALGSLASVIGASLAVTLAELAGIITAVNRPYVLWAETLERIVRAMERIGILSTQVPASLNATGGASGSNFRPDLAGGGDVDNREHQALTEREKELAEARKKALAAAPKIALEQSTDAARRELELQRHLTENLRLEHEKRGGEIQKFFDRQKTLADQHLTTLTEQIAREREINQRALDTSVIDHAEFESRKRDLSLRATEAKNAHDEAVRRLSLEKDRALVQAEVTLRKQSADLAETVRNGELARLKVDLDRQAITESEFLTTQLAHLKAAHEERLGIINFELKALTTSAERKAELDNEKRISEQKYTDEFKRLTKERTEAAEREQVAAFEASHTAKPLSDDQINQQAGAAADIAAGIPPALEQLSLLAELMDSIKVRLVDFSAAIRSDLIGAFHEMVGALGQGIAAWALYGESVGKSLQKALASILAQVAAEAAIQALLHAAYAIGKLAFGDFSGAAKHALAALKFTAVALAAGVGAKIVAANSFQQGAFESSGGGSNSNNRGSSASGANGRPTTVETQRVNYDTPRHDILEIRFKDTLGDLIEHHWVQRYNDKGRLRNLVLNDHDGG